MKKSIIYIVAALAALMTLSCQKETDTRPESPVLADAPVFYAGFADGETKAVIDRNGKQSWNAGDSIGVFYSTYQHKYLFDGAAGAREGSFKPAAIDGFIAATPLEGDIVYAVYPYRSQVETFTWTLQDGFQKEVGSIYGHEILLNGLLVTTLPNYQVWTPGVRVSPESNIMVAATSGAKDNKLAFKNVFGYLSVPIKGTATVQRVILMGNNGEQLAGKFLVKTSAQTAPEIVDPAEYFRYFNANYQSQLFLLPEVPVALNADKATEFCFVVPPVEFPNGFTVVVETTDGQVHTFNTENSRTIERNKTYTMASVVVNQSEEVLYRDPFTGSSDLLLHEYWWGLDVWVQLKYKEVNGVRYCTLTRTGSDNGIWDDPYGLTFSFLWYPGQTDGDGKQVIEVPHQYTGFTYPDWEPAPLEDAENPIYAMDAYYWASLYRGFSGTADAFYGQYGDAYPRCYYNPQNGKFSFTLTHFIPNVGGWSPMQDAAYLVGTAYRNDSLYGLSAQDGYPGENKVYAQVGSSITDLIYAVTPGELSDSGRRQMAQGMQNGSIATTTAGLSNGADYRYAQFTLPEMNPGLYSIMVMAFDNGEMMGYMDTTFSVWERMDDDWASVGTGQYTDDILASLFSLENLTWDVEIMQDQTDPSHYKMVYPYDGKFAYNEDGDWDTSRSYDIEFYIADDTHVYILPQPIGVNWGYGMTSMASLAGYYLSNGYSYESVVNGGIEFGTLENGVITFPEKAMVVYLAEYNNGNPMYANTHGLFKLVMPGYTDAAAGAAAPKIRSRVLRPKGLLQAESLR